MSEVRGAIWTGAAVALLVFAVLVSGGTLGGLVERGPFTSDFYDEQASALLHGRLDVDPDVASIEGFERDGKTYLYFGLVPAVLRLPIAAVTDDLDGRLTQLSMLLAMAVGLLAAGRLAWRGRRAVRGSDPAARWERWTVGGFTAGVGISSPLLFLGSRPLVYHEAEAWGVALALLAADRLLEWWEERDRGSLVVASLTAGLALNARASVGGGALAALALALLACARRDGLRATAWRSLAIVLPLVVYCGVNYARFEHPTRVPLDLQRLAEFDEVRQEVLAETDGTLFGVEFAPTATWAYVRPDGVRVQRLFPWITYRESTGVLGDATFDTIDRTASLPVASPAVTLLGILGLVALVRRRIDRAPWVCLVVGSALGTTLTVTIAFIAHRYLSDFVPVLVIPAALGVWVAADAIRAWSAARRRLVVGGLAALALFGGVVEGALSLQSQRLLVLSDAGDRRDMVALQYRIDDALTSGPPPDVRRDDDLTTVGHRGAVAIVGDCDALYWSDGRRWFPLEVGNARGWRVHGRIPEGRTVLLEAPGWQLVVDRTGDDVQASYRATGGPVRSGPRAPLDAVDDRDITVELDLVGSEIIVRAGGRDLLRTWLVDLTGAVEPGAGIDATPLPTPLCDDLAEATPP